MVRFVKGQPITEEQMKHIYLMRDKAKEKREQQMKEYEEAKELAARAEQLRQEKEAAEQEKKAMEAQLKRAKEEAEKKAAEPIAVPVKKPRKPRVYVSSSDSESDDGYVMIKKKTLRKMKQTKKVSKPDEPYTMAANVAQQHLQDRLSREVLQSAMKSLFPSAF